MFLGTPLGDAAYAAARANLYARSQLVANIDSTSVPPAITKPGDSSKTSAPTSADTQPQRIQPAANSLAQAPLDKVTISSAAKAAQPPVQAAPVSPTPSSTAASASTSTTASTTGVAAPNDTDSDLAQEASESVNTGTNVAEAGETTGQVSQSSAQQQVQPSPPSAAQSATSIINPGTPQAPTGGVNTYG